MNQQVCLWLFFLCLSAASSPAATHYVDLAGTNPVPPYTDWATAATGIMQAVSVATGGTVCVAEGVYLEQLYLTNALVLEGGYPTGGGVRDPSTHVTVVDGTNLAGSVVTLAGVTNVSISGMTITHGSKTSVGGGVYCVDSADITISNSVIRNNSARGGGAGVYIENASGCIADCMICSNAIFWDEPCGHNDHFGGGIYVGAGALVDLRGNTIEGNTISAGIDVYVGQSVTAQGGGVFWAGDGEITGNRIVKNLAGVWCAPRAGSYGGGLAVAASGRGLVAHNVIASNEVASDRSHFLVADETSLGGGLFCQSTNQMVFTGNDILRNRCHALAGGTQGYSTATALGGGMAVGCGLFTSNRAAGNIVWATNTASLGNVTASAGGSGVYAWSSGLVHRIELEGNQAMAFAWSPMGSQATALGNAFYGNGFSGELVSSLIHGHTGGAVFVVNSGMARLYNNTVANNPGGGIWAESSGGLQIANCILWGNGDDLTNCAALFSDIEDGDGGTGNISDDPLFAGGGDYRLPVGSPCINAGTNMPWMAGALDLDGRARLPDVRVDMGCYELAAPGVYVTSPAVTVSYDALTITLGGTNTAGIVGAMWVTNATKGDMAYFAAPETPPLAWTTPAIGLTAGTNHLFVMGSNAAGVVAFDSVEIVREVGAGVVRYVSVACANPVPPFSDWTTAATSIQDAVSWSVPGDTVLVGDGLYQSGTGMFIRGIQTRVVITNGLVVRSENGPSGAVISGGGMRGVYVGSDACLSGFTVRDGMAGNWDDPEGKCGGGVYAEPDGRIENCIIRKNQAVWLGGGVFGGIIRSSVIDSNASWDVGGGAGMATLYNCIVRGNGAPGNGGGLEKGEAVNCVFHNNQAGPGSNGGGANDSVIRGCTVITNKCDWDGGGVSGGRVENSIVYHNYRDHGGVRFENNLSCTDVVYTCTTPNPGGVGNITNHPLFVDAGSFDYHLQSNSPCINAGSNQAWMAGTRDMDGQGRILYGVADMGADEYGYDPEGFGMYTLPAGMATEWVGVSNLTYRFQYCDDVAAGSWTDVDAIFTGTVPVLTITDTNPVARRFYRVIRLEP